MSGQMKKEAVRKFLPEIEILAEEAITSDRVHPESDLAPLFAKIEETRKNIRAVQRSFGA